MIYTATIRSLKNEPINPDYAVKVLSRVHINMPCGGCFVLGNPSYPEKGKGGFASRYSFEVTGKARPFYPHSNQNVAFEDQKANFEVYTEGYSILVRCCYEINFI